MQALPEAARPLRAHVHDLALLNLVATPRLTAGDGRHHVQDSERLTAAGLTVHHGHVRDGQHTLDQPPRVIPVAEVAGLHQAEAIVVWGGGLVGCGHNLGELAGGDAHGAVKVSVRAVHAVRVQAVEVALLEATHTGWKVLRLSVATVTTVLVLPRAGDVHTAIRCPTAHVAVGLKEINCRVVDVIGRAWNLWPCGEGG